MEIKKGLLTGSKGQFCVQTGQAAASMCYGGWDLTDICAWGSLVNMYTLDTQPQPDTSCFKSAAVASSVCKMVSNGITWHLLWGLNTRDNSLFFSFSPAVTSTGVNVYYNRHTCPMPPSIYRHGLMGVDSYFRFHHFLFIIHGFHSTENNHISIRALSGISSRQTNITLCFVKNLEFSLKAGWEISVNELLKLSAALVLSY